MPEIHPSAIVSSEAKLADDVSVGAFSVIEGSVTIGSGTRIGEHVTIKGNTHIGANNVIHKGTAIGEPAQDFTFDNWEGKIQIGDNNVFRENCTVHLPVGKSNITTIGSHGYFMVNAHVAHDCVVGDHVILVNNCALGGYVRVENNAYISHSVGVVQFCRIGAYAIIGAVSKVAQDVPPFVMATGTTAMAHGLNVVGMKRAGFSPEERKGIKEAFKILYLSKLTVKSALRKMETELIPRYQHDIKAVERIQQFIDFIRGAKKGIIGYSETHG